MFNFSVLGDIPLFVPSPDQIVNAHISRSSTSNFQRSSFGHHDPCSGDLYQKWRNLIIGAMYTTIYTGMVCIRRYADISRLDNLCETDSIWSASLENWIISWSSRDDSWSSIFGQHDACSGDLSPKERNLLIGAVCPTAYRL